MKRTLIAALLAIAAVPFLMGAEADAGAFQAISAQCNGGVEDGQIESTWADGENLYVGTAEGQVFAVDRNNGVTRWVYPRTTELPFAPGASAVDMVADEDRVYVAYANKFNGFEDPVVAIDKSSGEAAWKQTYTKNNLTVALDPFRLAQDGQHLYVGKDGGQVFKIRKSDGALARGPAGEELVYHPTTSWSDDNGAGEMAPTFTDPTGIWALEQKDGVLWAAQNWGDASQSMEVNWTDPRNHIIILDTGDFSASEVELTRSGQTTNWAVHDFWADPDSSDLYVVGSARANNGGNTRSQPMGFFARALQSDLAVAIDQVRFTGSAQGGGLEVGDGQWGTSNPAAINIVLEVHGDAEHVYSVTGQHPESNVGYFLKHDKADFSLQDDWGSLRTLGRGAMRTVFVDAEPDGQVFVGTECLAAGVGPAAGVVAQVEKAMHPVVDLLSPSNGELTKGRMDLGVWVHTPSDYTGKMRARFYVSSNGGACADGASCYTDLRAFTDARSDAELEKEFNPNQVALFKDIDMSELPAGGGYVLMVEVEDDLGRTYRDRGEVPFLIDYEPPNVGGIQPEPDAVLHDSRPHIRATYRDDLSLVDTGKITLSIDGFPIGLAPSFFDENGLDVDLSAPETGFNGLKEGTNTIRLTVPDRSGNVAEHEWRVRVDTSVKSPVLDPSSNSFVREVRPIISAQFFEEVAPQDGGVVFQGTDVTSQTTIIAPQGGLGTRLLWQPTQDLQAGTLYTISFGVVDGIGNKGGPYTATFRVDAEAPEVRNLRPVPGALLTEGRPTLRFTLQDAGSGVQENSLAVFLDGRDITRDLERNVNLIEYRPGAALHEGGHTVSVTVMDGAGNLVTEAWGFQVDLSRPSVDVDVELPADQSALKQGDEVLVRVAVQDESPVRSVHLDLRGLDASLGARVVPNPVPGQTGVYEYKAMVKASQTRVVSISATAEDLGGLVGQGAKEARLDNNPPQTVLHDLSAFVGQSFELTWENKPRDDIVGGSGIAYYRIEQAKGDGEWQVIRARHTDTSLQMEITDADFATLSFRIFAVDNAGNVQPSPSNVVKTVVRGDPFPEPDVPDVLVRNGTNIFRATPAPQVPLEDGTAFVRLVGADGVEHDLRLDGFGRIYSGAHDVASMPEGDYILRFHFRDHQGFEMVGKSYAVRIVSEDEAALLAAEQDSPKQESPFLGLLLLPLLLAAARGVRR